MHAAHFKRYTNGFMEKEDDTNFICVLKTGKLFEHDIASNALFTTPEQIYNDL